MRLVTQLSPTLCDPTESSPSGSSVHGDSPGKNAEMGCHSLLQRIFPTQGSHPGQTHCRQILHHLGHQGMSSPKLKGFPGGASGKEPTCQCRRHNRCRFRLWVGKLPRRRAGQPTPGFLPGEAHGRRNPVTAHRVAMSQTQLR